MACEIPSHPFWIEIMQQHEMRKPKNHDRSQWTLKTKSPRSKLTLRGLICKNFRSESKASAKLNVSRSTALAKDSPKADWVIDIR